MIKKFVVVLFIIAFLYLTVTSCFSDINEGMECYKGKTVRILPKSGLGTIGEVLKVHSYGDNTFMELRLMRVFGQSVIFIINVDDILYIEVLSD